MGVGMLRVTAVSVWVVVVVATGSFSSAAQEIRSIMAQAGSAGNRRVNLFIMSVCSKDNSAQVSSADGLKTKFLVVRRLALRVRDGWKDKLRPAFPSDKRPAARRSLERLHH